MVLGVAGAGKTRFGRFLAEKLGVKFIDIPEYVKAHGLQIGYDEEAQAYIVDFRRVSAKVGGELGEKGAVIASIHPFKPRGAAVRAAIVLRIRPDRLIEILEARGYPRWKIVENVSAELVDKPLHDAVAKFGEEKVVQVDVTEKNFEEFSEQVAEALKAERERELWEKVDWISLLESLNMLDEILEYLSRYSRRKNLF